MPLKKIQSTASVMFRPTALLNFSSNNATMLTLLENFRGVVVRFRQLLLLPQKLFQIHKTHFSHQ